MNRHVSNSNIAQRQTTTDCSVATATVFQGKRMPLSASVLVDHRRGGGRSETERGGEGSVLLKFWPFRSAGHTSSITSDRAIQLSRETPSSIMK